MESIKAIGIFLITLLSYTMTYGQDDVLNEYNNHKFPCDEGGTTLETNICSGNKRDYADSLLNIVYNKIMRSIEKEIAGSKNSLKLEQAKKDSIRDKGTMKFLVEEIDRNERLKKNIIKSELAWIKERDLNFIVASINCEGGTGFVACENQSLINDTLYRIKKLQSFYYIDDY